MPPGQHVGIQKDFSANTTAGQAAVEARFQEAIDAGMQLHIYHLDWQSIERREGQFDMTDLKEGLDTLAFSRLKTGNQVGRY